jgi:hypothetical protein
VALEPATGGEPVAAGPQKLCQTSYWALKAELLALASRLASPATPIACCVLYTVCCVLSLAS